MNQPGDIEKKQRRKTSNAKKEEKSGVFIAVIWLLLAFALLVVVVLAPKLLETIMPEGSSVFEPYVTVFVGNAGLEIIALLIFLATVGNLAFRDPLRRFAFEMTNEAITSIQSSMENGFRKISSAVREGTADLDAQIIKRWIKNDSGVPDEYKSIGLNALQQYYGDHTRDRDSYFNYLFENFLDESLPESEIWRKDVTSTIKIKKATEPNFAVQRGLFIWSETKTFNLICPSGCDEHHIRTRSSLAVDKEIVGEALKAYDFRIDIDVNRENIFSLEERLGNLSVDDLGKALPIEYDDLSIEHDGRRLHIKVTKVVEVPSNIPLPIFTTEEVFLEPDDRTYILSCRWPTQNLNTNFSLGAGMQDWEIINATVGPERYHPKAETLGDISFSEKRDSVNIWVPNWVLPGLAVVVEWCPKTSKM